MSKYKCVLCGKDKEGFGNNAQPLANGRCCDICNLKVLKTRIERLYETKGGLR